jgi:hypothetical protein
LEPPAGEPEMPAPKKKQEDADQPLFEVPEARRAQHPTPQPPKAAEQEPPAPKKTYEKPYRRRQQQIASGARPRVITVKQPDPEPAPEEQLPPLQSGADSGRGSRYRSLNPPNCTPRKSKGPLRRW